MHDSDDPKAMLRKLQELYHAHSGQYMNTEEKKEAKKEELTSIFASLSCNAVEDLVSL